MKVLIACEESQEVCKAFRERGHEAYSCDLQPCSGGCPDWHIMHDVLDLIDGDCTFKTQGGGEVTVKGQWDMIIAHPPCTYLSNAGACRLYKTAGRIDKERYRKGIEAKAFFLRIMGASCAKIAIENPVQMRVFNIPCQSQTIQPYMFGHPYTKRTRLWLKGLPPLFATELVIPKGPYLPSNTSAKDSTRYGYAKRGEDAKNRAKTFPGIAKAMAEQWG